MPQVYKPRKYNKLIVKNIHPRNLEIMSSAMLMDFLKQKGISNQEASLLIYHDIDGFCLKYIKFEDLREVDLDFLALDFSGLFSDCKFAIEFEKHYIGNLLS